MSSVLMDTADLDEAEAVLSLNFSKMRLQTSDPLGRMRIDRSYVGSLGVDSASYAHGFDFDMDPPEKILLCGVVEGGVEYGAIDQQTVRLAPGQLGVIGAPDERPITGRLSRGRYDHLIVEPRLLSEHTGQAPGSERGVRLVGMTPVSPEAARRLASVMDYVKRCAAMEEVAANPLLAATLERHVAAVLVTSLPTEALLELAKEEPHEGGPALLRRAEAFIEENAHTDLSLHDIAGSIYVNPRTLQYMFRKHRDCTPMDYVRRVRLHHAHLDLVACNRLDTTVGQIAAKWGFGHLGRFAIYYREKYGQSPHLTLRGY